MKVKVEIKKFSKEEDKECLLWLLSKWHMRSEWLFVANCHFLKKPYPNNHRVWFPTKAGRILFNNKEEYENQI